MATAAERPIRRVVRAPSAGTPPDPVDSPAGRPPTAGQRRAWFLAQWAPGTAVDRSVALVRLAVPAGADDVRAVLQAVTAERAALGERYAQGPEGVVRLPGVAQPDPVPLAVTDHRSVEEVTRQALRSPLDPVAGPLASATLSQRAADGPLLALAVHRIAADPSGAEDLVDDLARRLRGAGVAGPTRSPVPREGLAASTSSAGDVATEATRLAGLIPVTPPFDTRPPASRSWATATASRPVAASSTGLDRLEQLVAALAALLSRYTGVTDVAVGTPADVAGDPLANPVVLRLDLSGDPTAAELSARARAAVAAARGAAAVPFDLLVAALAPEREPTGHPVLRVVAEVSDWRRREPGAIRPPHGASLVDLTVRSTLRPGGAVELVAEYAVELFERGRVERLLAHLEEIATDVTAAPDRRLGELALLTLPERRQVATCWNATARDYQPSGVRLHDLVHAWVEQTPDAPACRFLGRTRSYGELGERAGRLASRLLALGVGPEQVVAVALERGWDLPVALLGVLQAGGAYLPLDPSHPPSRLAGQVVDAGCRVAVADERSAGVLPAGLTVVAADGSSLREPGPRPAAPSRVPSRGQARPGNLAYVIFTSGSTGRPKGTMVEHRSVVNYVRHCQERFGLGPGDRLLQFANPCFDVSVFDIFCALGNGATVVHAPRSTLLDPRALTRLLASEQVTMADLPPAIPAMLDPAELPSLRRLSIGGEAVPGDLVRRWRAPDRDVYNIYGPTEATVTCLDHACPLDDSAADPVIGSPIANLTAYVVDRHVRLLPAGVPGELLVGGVGVTRGYLGSPGLTAERFVPDPLGPPGGRLYRTGDLVRWRADGTVEFVGRVDRQLKLRGQRIEPGEVEAALRRHPDVASAVVHAPGDDLVAYLVPMPDRTVPDLAAVRELLGDSLPGYLVPSAVVALPALPLTPNAKVDLAALPSPQVGAAPDWSRPSTPHQAAVAAAWSRVLGTAAEHVRPDDSFFEVGGDSLRALALREQLRRTCSVEIDLPAFWAEPTPAALARAVRARQRGVTVD